MVTIEALKECLLYSNKLRELQTKKEEHQNAIVNVAATQEDYMHKIKICKYVMLGIIGLILVYAVCLLSGSEGSEGSVMLVMLSIAFVITLCVRFKFNSELKEVKASEASIKEHHCVEITAIDERIATTCEEILDKKLFDIIPPSYFYPSAIKYIISLFNRRLADSMKEAFNLLEAEIQRSDAIQRQNEFSDSLIREIQQLTDAVNLNTYLTMKE